MIDLINDKIDIIKAFQLLSLLLEDLDNKKIKNWLNFELNGYPKDADVPKYRVINASIVGVIIAYKKVIYNYNIPLPTEERVKLCKHTVRNSILEIVNYSKAEVESDKHYLLSPIDLEYINHVALINDAEITHASLRLNMYGYTNILNILKNKLIDILKNLEKQYGNLDEYYVNFKTNENKKGTEEVILKIIFNDNSINLGNNNKINKSKVGNYNDKNRK